MRPVMAVCEGDFTAVHACRGRVLPHSAGLISSRQTLL